MLIWNQSKLTTAGKALLAKAQGWTDVYPDYKGTDWIRKLFFRGKPGKQNSAENTEADLPDSEQKHQRSRQYTYSEDCDHKQERNRNTEHWLRYHRARYLCERSTERRNPLQHRNSQHKRLHAGV